MNIEADLQRWVDLTTHPQAQGGVLAVQTLLGPGDVLAGAAELRKIRTTQRMSAISRRQREPSEWGAKSHGQADGVFYFDMSTNPPSLQRVTAAPSAVPAIAHGSDCLRQHQTQYANGIAAAKQAVPKRSSSWFVEFVQAPEGGTVDLALGVSRTTGTSTAASGAGGLAGVEAKSAFRAQLVRKAGQPTKVYALFSGANNKNRLVRCLLLLDGDGYLETTVLVLLVTVLKYPVVLAVPAKPLLQLDALWDSGQYSQCQKRQ